MTAADLGVDAFVVLGAVAGARFGLAREAGGWAAWAAALALPWLSAAPVARALAPVLGERPGAVYVFCWAALGALAWLAVRLGAFALVERRRNRRAQDGSVQTGSPLAGWDRAAAALAGGVRAAGVAWLALSVLAVTGAQSDARTRPWLAGSDFFAFAREHNAVVRAHRPEIAALRRRVEADRAALSRVPASLRTALERGDGTALLADAQVLALLLDGESTAR